MGMTMNTLLLLAATASALQCSKDTLSQYKLQELPLAKQSIVADTPPSKTDTTWYFNLCQAEGVMPEACAKNSQICGVQEVLLPGQDAIVSQVISWGQGLSYEVTNNTDSGLVITMGENSWGANTVEAQLVMNCAKEELMVVQWEHNSLTLQWNTPFACLADSKAPPPDKPKDDAPEDGDRDKDKDKVDDSWGWFTWLFIILVLGFGVYIIMGAWITYTKSPADLSDAVHDFVDTLKGITQAVPGFLGEVFGRVMGRTDRGGYSAV